MNLFGVLSEVYPTLLTGLTMTVKITILSLIIALVIGIFVCLMNISSNIVLRGIAKFYIWLIRGTPMLVQAFYFYFALPQLIQAVTGSQFRITVFTASLVTLALNAGAYISEIFRGSIESVNKGQMEAGRSLGLNKFQTMRYIIIPQAFKSILPPLGNEFIVLIKETSIVGYVGMSDLTRVANQMTSKLFDVFTPLLGIAFIYFVLTKVLSILLAKLERRLRKSDNR